MPKEIIRIILMGIGLGSLSAIVYMAGPLVAFGNLRPLENPIVRDIVVVLLVAGAASITGVRLWRRRKGAADVADSLSRGEQEPSDETVLKGRMDDALATLKNARGGRTTYLYDLPWYVIIGRPGAGKTTALVNSGLKFPLAAGGRPGVVAGKGGTRYCDWWFTEDAVLIDTAGRYTTFESDARSDQKSWFAFLDTLKKGRPKQPINGVLAAISVEDLLTLGAAELASLAAAMRARLLELHTQLRIDFPVYVLFTKMDLVLGFNEFFQNLGSTGRAQVFGATFQTSDKTSNLVAQVPAEFEALVESLNEEMLDRLQDEPAPATRAQLYGFPTQMEALKRPLFDMLTQIFEPTRFHANAILRGFYFTSGTQEGTPIDQLIGALEKSFGTVEVAASSYSGEGRSYFLADLITKVIIGEAAWVSTDRAAVRRATLLKASAYAGLILVSFGLAALWWISYGRNAALIADTRSAVADYAASDNGVSRQTSIATHDLSKVLPQLGRLRTLPAGYAERTDPVPVAETFGLSQHDRLQSAAVTAYHVGLERMFRPRLIVRLEEVLDARRNDPDAVYATLKVYKMLGGLHKTDPALVLDWMRRDWANNLYIGEGNEPGRRALEEHLQAMLDLEDGDKPLVSLSQTLLGQSETALAQLSVAQRAYELLKSQASTAARQPDWSLLRQGGAQLATVFEPAGPEGLATIGVPYFYTYDGFHHAFLARLDQIAGQIDAERWVLGDQANQASLAEQYKTLPQDLLAIYARDSIAAWQQMLRKIRLKRLATDKAYVALTAAASPTSPIRQLIESIRDQTAVTRAPRPAADAQDAKTPPPASTLLQDGAPGAPIEDAFRGYQDMLAGDAGTRPIDQLLKILGGIASDLKRQASNPSERPEANADLQLQVAALRNLGPSLPAPFADMMQGAAAEFDSAEVRTTLDLLSQELGAVADACKAATDNRYPFVRGADREIGLVDFGKLFGPGGDLDALFNRSLAKFAERTARGWVWKSGDPVGRALSPGVLKSFQDAGQIRDAYFGSGAAQPSFMVTVTPPVITDPNVTAKVDFYGTPIVAQSGNATPTAASWPGAGAYQVKITLATVAPAEASPAGTTSPPATPPAISTLVNKTGVWSLFRLLDDAGRAGGAVSFYSGGQTYKFQFAAASAANPLNLALLRQFQCPARI